MFNSLSSPALGEQRPFAKAQGARVLRHMLSAARMRHGEAIRRNVFRSSALVVMPRL
jgi:hypothetical protein